MLVLPPPCDRLILIDQLKGPEGPFNSSTAFFGFEKAKRKKK
jgi:hypothetical protein